MRRTSEQVIAEFHRLYDSLEVMVDCMRNHDGNYWTTGSGRLMMTRARALELIAEKTATPSQVLAGLREALNDTSEDLTHMLEDDPESAQKALEKYRSRTGRDYWEDAGDPKKQVKAILKRGRLLNNTEYRLLDAWLADTTNLVLKGSDRSLAGELMGRWEQTAPKEI